MGFSNGSRTHLQMQEIWETGVSSVGHGLGRSSEGGHGNPLQDFYLENPMHRGAWQAIVHSVTKSRTRLKWPSMHTHISLKYWCLTFLPFMNNMNLPWVRASLVAQRERIHLPMQETWLWSLGREDPLKEGMATHSSILAWRIPWTEEPGGLKSIGSERVEYDWSDLAGKDYSVAILI